MNTQPQLTDIKLDGAVFPFMPKLLNQVRTGPVPTKIILYRAGKTSTAKGEVIWSARSAVEVNKVWQERGTLIAFDYDHMMVRAQTPEQGVAAGWGRLVATPEYCAIIDIEWTPRALEKLKAGEYRYLSPFIFVDEATKEIVDVVNAALTNLPATHHSPILLSRSTLMNPVAPATPEAATPAVPAPMAQPTPPATSEIDPEIVEAVAYLVSKLKDGDPLKDMLMQYAASNGIDLQPEMLSLPIKCSRDVAMAAATVLDCKLVDPDLPGKVMLLHALAMAKKEEPVVVAPVVPEVPKVDEAAKKTEILASLLTDGQINRAMEPTYKAMTLSQLESFQRIAPKAMFRNKGEIDKLPQAQPKVPATSASPAAATVPTAPKSGQRAVHLSANELAAQKRAEEVVAGLSHTTGGKLAIELGRSKGIKIPGLAE